MFRRLLLDPAPVDGGGAPPAPAQPAPAPAPAQPAPAPTISLSVDQYQALLAHQSLAEQLKAEKLREVEEANRKATDALFQKGEVEKARQRLEEDYTGKLKAAEQARAELESKFHGKLKGESIRDALAAHGQVKPSMAPHLARLWANDFEVAPDHAGELVVRDVVTKRPAAAVIAERLASPDYADFLAPSTTGGAAGSTRHGTAPGAAGPQAPADPQAAMLAQVKAALDARKGRYIGL